MTIFLAVEIPYVLGFIFCVTFLQYSYSFLCNAGLARALSFWNNVVERLTLGSVYIL